jgi:hypothetical protein
MIANPGPMILGVMKITRATADFSSSIPQSTDGYFHDRNGMRQNKMSLIDTTKTLVASN